MELSKFKTKAWAWTLAIGLILWFCGPIRPDGVSLAAWHMFAIFVATIVGCITQPLPIAGTTLVGFTVIVLVGLAPMKGALTAFSNSSAWLIAMAFMLLPGLHQDRPGTPDCPAVRAELRSPEFGVSVLHHGNRPGYFTGYPI